MCDDVFWDAVFFAVTGEIDEYGRKRKEKLLYYTEQIEEHGKEKEMKNGTTPI